MLRLDKQYAAESCLDCLIPTCVPLPLLMIRDALLLSQLLECGYGTYNVHQHCHNHVHDLRWRKRIDIIQVISNSMIDSRFSGCAAVHV